MQYAWVSYYYSSSTLYLFFFPIPLIVMLALPSPSQLYNLDPGLYSGLPSPLSTTVHALIFIARRIQCFLPSSIIVDMYLPTLLGDFSGLLILSSRLFRQLFNADKAHNGDYFTQGPPLVSIVVVVFECNPTRPPGRPALYHSLPRWRVRLYHRAWY